MKEENNISMYPEDATKVTIEVTAKHSEHYKLTNLGPACQFLLIEIHCKDIRFGLDHNIKLDMADDWGEKELEDIRDC
jgi:hypothetical protein